MNVVVTSGGTVAPIDDVRRIANVSTGRFGAMIAEAALRRGARVWHLHAPGAQRPFDRSAKLDLDATDLALEIRRLERLRADWLEARSRCHSVPLATGTLADYAGRLEEIFRRHRVDVAFLAMAASDFAPEPFAGKLSSDSTDLVLRCRRLPKVIQSVRDWSPTVYLVGFKLMSNVPEADLIDRAESACRSNRADLTVANDLSTVRAGKHAIHLVRPGHPTETYGPDDSIADRLVDRAFAWASERSGTGKSRN